MGLLVKNIERVSNSHMCSSCIYFSANACIKAFRFLSFSFFRFHESASQRSLLTLLYKASLVGLSLIESVSIPYSSLRIEILGRDAISWKPFSLYSFSKTIFAKVIKIFLLSFVGIAPALINLTTFEVPILPPFAL